MSFKTIESVLNMSGSGLARSGILIVTDPDQEKAGYYKICKTINAQQTVISLNAARAAKDFKTIKFLPVNDLKKSEDFVKQAMNKKYISGST